MSSKKPNQNPRRCVLTDDDRLLIAKCKAERVVLRERQARLKREHKQVTQDLYEIGNAALAGKFGCSISTIDLVPVEGA
jgi:hypothetical protein